MIFSEEQLGKRIKQLREKSDWTQAELASKMNLDNEDIGLDDSKISKIESGIRKVSAKEVTRFSEVFGVTTDYLLGNENMTSRNSISNKQLLVAAHIDDDASEVEMEDIINYIEFRKKNPLKK
ncbi:transcriptional regulator [Enterococcus florum]|uniref:Transcriptional regulator n=1 Tax=Enterococcus florum TaxID=2480627 RepID=A0A4P5P4W2_9ENTE|nr:helix-turn-helix transcriptional regulator [Enterococcus florum]GCF92466.1 transcriptional regulator [Enterococcus florum]